MSNPFVYTPSTPLQYPSSFQQTPYYYTPRSATPFLPDANLYNSPYSNPNSLPGTPHIRSAGIPFPGGGGGYDDSYAAPWGDFVRTRRPSWHGAPPPASAGGGVGAFLQPQPYPTHLRRHSFGTHTNPYAPQQYADYLSPYGYSAFAQGQDQSFYINPWLNAEAPRADFLFDLAPTAFLPLRLYGRGESAPLTQEDLAQPATHPPLTRLRIVCDMIPDWPIDLELRGGYSPAFSPGYQPPPITLVDVLIAVHRSLHQGCSHVEWARLNPVQEREVARAYTRRCKAVGSAVDQELAQGVKRVDFLLKKTRMLGLLRAGQVDGWDIMKLIVTEM